MAAAAEYSLSLPEVHRSIPVPTGASFWRKLLAFAGPGYLVAVGYMDPGNWATDLAGGARFGYTLLSVIMMSNLMAILLQALAARLGIVTRPRSGAGLPRELLAPRGRVALWIACEIAIAACDLAEVLGAAIALNLLFRPAADLGRVADRPRRARRALSAAPRVPLCRSAGRRLDSGDCGVVCDRTVVRAAETCRRCHGIPPGRGDRGDPGMLYIAIGILGATVMPHNLYLHSSIVQTRNYDRQRREQARGDPVCDDRLHGCADVGALHQCGDSRHGGGDVPRKRPPRRRRYLRCVRAAFAAARHDGRGVLFAIALLCSGQNATLTGTLAGQIVMEGFINFRLRPWLRRLITRLLAIIPAIVVVFLYGERGTGALIILSQVILSLQLPFAVFPLIMFTSDPRKMGAFVAPVWMRGLAWVTGLVIAVLNGWLLYQTAVGLL